MRRYSLLPTGSARSLVFSGWKVQQMKAVKPPERKRVLRAMGTTFKSLTEGTFNSAGAQYRPQPWPAKKDGSLNAISRKWLGADVPAGL